MYCLCCRVVEMNVKKGTIEIKNLLKKAEVPKMFTYDAVYDWKYVIHVIYYANLYHSYSQHSKTVKGGGLISQQLLHCIILNIFKLHCAVNEWINQHPLQSWCVDCG